jgi:N-acetylneuraminic acid mutarotase
MKRLKLAFYASLLFLPVFLFGDWVYKTPLNVSRGGLVCEVVNGKIYAIGGRQGNDILTGVCEEYDPQLDTWVIKSSMPTPRYSAISGVVGNKIYVIGGDTNTNIYYPSATNIIEAFDPLQNTWETVNSVWPFPLSGAAGATVGDWIYTMGGVLWGHQHIYFDTVEAYNPILNQWVVKRSMHTPRAYFDAAASDNKVYALGGQFYGSLVRCEVYDTITNTWDSIRSLPTSRAYFASVALEEKIFVIGGYEGQQNFLSRRVDYYQPSINNWTRYPNDLNQARYRLGAVVIGNDIYAIGGRDNRDNYYGTVEQTTFVGIDETEDTLPEIITKNIPTFIPAGKAFILSKNRQLFDATGRKVNSTNLKRGLYFLLIKEEKVRVKKIIVY